MTLSDAKPPGHAPTDCDRFYVRAEELADVLKGPEKVMVVDVRDADYVGGHIKGSVNVPSKSFDDDIAELLKGDMQGVDRVVVTCMLSKERGPRCARKLINLMNEIDVPNKPKVKVLEDGYGGFLEKFGPTSDMVEMD